MATTHIATLPDGTEVRRISENRKYTHCYAYPRKDDGSWWVGGWSGSEALAHKAARTRVFNSEGYKVIACQQVEGRKPMPKTAKKGAKL